MLIMLLTPFQNFQFYLNLLFCLIYLIYRFIVVLQEIICDYHHHHHFQNYLKNKQFYCFFFLSLIHISRHLTPSQLSRYLYPQLSAYKDENTISIPRMNLSTRTILAVYFLLCFFDFCRDRPIYVLVGFRSIIVYYAYENNPSPPSSSSKFVLCIF